MPRLVTANYITESDRASQPLLAGEPVPKHIIEPLQHTSSAIITSNNSHTEHILPS
jgi:hypothetical protein